MLATLDRLLAHVAPALVAVGLGAFLFAPWQLALAVLLAPLLGFAALAVFQALCDLRGR